MSRALFVKEDSMNASKKLQVIYALCAAAGVAFTMYFNVQFIVEHGGFSVTQFLTETYINNASTSITNDLLVIVVAFLIWSFIEARRLKMRNWWAYVIPPFLTTHFSRVFKQHW